VRALMSVPIQVTQEVKQFAVAAMFALVAQAAQRRRTRGYSSFDLVPAICVSVLPLKRKLVQSSIAFAPICL
jgi:hypothetical protein